MELVNRPPLFSSIEVAGKSGKQKRRGLIDVDEVIGGMTLEPD